MGDSRLRLSEERKVKIAIARAVLKNPRILLLDEATGTLDMEAAQNVQQALDILMLGRSSIVIAHRLSSVRNADVIAVLDEGQLVEMGTHDELMRLDGAYIDLIRLQETAKQPRRYGELVKSKFAASNNHEYRVLMLVPSYDVKYLVHIFNFISFGSV